MYKIAIFALKISIYRCAMCYKKQYANGLKDVSYTLTVCNSE